MQILLGLWFGDQQIQPPVWITELPIKGQSRSLPAAIVISFLNTPHEVLGENLKQYIE